MYPALKPAIHVDYVYLHKNKSYCHMETTAVFNNHILTDQERRQLTIIADETIQTFAESIDGIHQVIQEFPPSQNHEFNHIMDTMNDVSTFISYSFGDCIVLTKYFLNTEIQYEKSFLRGKLKVQLNESFKRLYGFNEKAHKESYCSKLQEIIHMFPGFKLEFGHILSDLDDISKQDSWWKDVRNAEVHIDIPMLYESRHEEINESKEVMETMRLVDFFLRFNNLIARMNQAYINHLWRNLKTEDKYTVLKSLSLDQ